MRLRQAAVGLFQQGAMLTIVGVLLLCSDRARAGDARDRADDGVMSAEDYLRVPEACRPDAPRVRLVAESDDLSFLAGRALQEHGIPVALSWPDWSVDDEGWSVEASREAQGGMPRVYVGDHRIGFPGVHGRGPCVLEHEPGLRLTSQLDLAGVLAELEVHLAGEAALANVEVGLSVGFGDHEATGDFVLDLLRSPPATGSPTAELLGPVERRGPERIRVGGTVFVLDASSAPVRAHVELSTTDLLGSQPAGRGRLYDMTGEHQHVLYFSSVAVAGSRGRPRPVQGQILDPDRCLRAETFAAHAPDCRDLGFERILARLDHLPDPPILDYVNPADAHRAVSVGQMQVVLFGREGLAVLDPSAPAVADVLIGSQPKSTGVPGWTYAYPGLSAEPVAIASRGRSLLVSFGMDDRACWVGELSMGRDGRLQLESASEVFHGRLIVGLAVQEEWVHAWSVDEAGHAILLTLRQEDGAWVNHHELEVPGRFGHLHLDGQTLFVGLERWGLLVVDVSEPAAPAVLLHHEEPPREELEYDIREVHHHGEMLFAPNGHGEPELLAFGFTPDHRSIERVEGFDLGGDYESHTVVPVGPRRLVATHASGDGVVVLDVADPWDPQVVGFARLDYAQDIEPVAGRADTLLAVGERGMLAYVDVGGRDAAPAVRRVGPTAEAVAEPAPLPPVVVSPLGATADEVAQCTTLGAACGAADGVCEDELSFPPLALAEEDDAPCRLGVAAACREAAGAFRLDESLKQALLGRACELGLRTACEDLAGTLEDRKGPCAQLLQRRACWLGSADACAWVTEPGHADLYDTPSGRWGGAAGPATWETLGIATACRRTALGRACDVGDEHACQRLLEVLLAWEPLPEEVDEASAVLQQRCEAGNGQRCMHLGLVSERLGDDTRARTAYEAACAAGEPMGCVAGQLLDDAAPTDLSASCSEAGVGSVWSRVGDPTWLGVTEAFDGCGNLARAYATGDVLPLRPGRATWLVDGLASICESEPEGAGTSDADSDADSDAAVKLRSEACHALAGLTLAGIAVPRNPEAAIAALETHASVVQPDPGSVVVAALARAEAGGDLGAASESLETLCDEWGAPCLDLASDLAWGASAWPLPRHAAVLYDDLCARGIPRACYGLGNLLEDGRLGAVDMEAAVAAWERGYGLEAPPGSDEETAEQYARYAVLVRSSVAVARSRMEGADVEAILPVLRDACEEYGMSGDCLAEAQLLSAPGAAHQDDARAAELYTLLCNATPQYTPEACTSLAAMQQQGRAEEGRYSPMALKHRACLYGDAVSCAELARVYRAGTDLPQDEDLATMLLDRACSDEEPAEVCEEPR